MIRVGAFTTFLTCCHDGQDFRRKHNLLEYSQGILGTANWLANLRYGPSPCDEESTAQVWS